ncbi:uncharacterized protein si:ch211-158d24.4 [Pimephales promelas]|uniref:uncharacterized protein si:ch211-158d24.4 n=1 Tax=Pimephales promelas TaxID=90988 RepID=UPI00195579F5|nr:uncharacterized protein si:ch211-158d24.4 [Pimephales promelas]KAG1930914.1 hypothetical protein F2P79_021932 [Pimephales promelas]
MEMGKEDIVAKECVVLIKPKSRLKTQFHSLRRQVYFFQSICVLFCFTSCLYMIISHAYPSTCKENITEAPKIAMQRQSSKAVTPTQMNTPIIRLTVNGSGLLKNGNFANKEQLVPWQLSQENLAPNHNEYLTLENNTSLRVNHDGTYKVSLQITYRGTNEWMKTTGGSSTLEHNIKYHTDRYGNGALLLLTYIETVTFTSQYWKKSMFSEGIFFLQSGDRLEVGTNSLRLIDSGITAGNVFVVYPHFST